MIKKIFLLILVIFFLLFLGFLISTQFSNILKQEGQETSIGQNTNTTKINPETNNSDKKETIEISKGTYVVYKEETVVNIGQKDWSNDDTKQTVYFWYRIEDKKIQEFSRVTRSGEETTGSLVEYKFGPEILVHRFGSKEEDALISLDGTVKTEEANWNRLSSKDGSLLVNFDEVVFRGDNQTWMTVIKNGQELAKVRIDRTVLNSTKFVPPTPVWISDDNNFVYLISGPYEGLEKYNVWRFDVATKQFFSPTYFDKYNLYEIHYNAATNQIIGVEAKEKEDNNAMGGWSPGAPSTIHLVDPINDMGQIIQTDEDFYLNRVSLSSDGSGYVYYINDSDAIWLDQVGSGKARNKHLTSGQLLNWVDHYLVLDRDGVLSILDLETSEMLILDRAVGSYSDSDYKKVDYITTIKID